MASQLKLVASDYTGQKVPCTFKATANGTDLPTKDDEDPLFDIPADAHSVTVTVKPKWNATTPVWEETFSFSIGPDHSLAVDVDLRGRRVELMSSFVQDFRFTLAIVKMSKFRDRTKEVFALLDRVPTTRMIWNKTKKKREPVNVDEVGLLARKYGAWPPPNWDLSRELEAHFLDPANPLTSSRELNFKKPLLDIKVDSVVLERAGVRVVPQYFAVTWPKAIAPHLKPTPAPFLLFLRQNNFLNYFLSGEFLDAAYPEHFDYAYYGLFESLHYAGSPLRFPGSKGVPYQAVKAGLDVVTVCPCYGYSVLPSGEYGDLMDPEETEKLLKELQAYMFWKDGVDAPPNSIGKTATGAFSAGNFLPRNWLMNDDKRKGHFLSSVVRAMYFFDPVKQYVDPKTQKVVEFLDDLIASARKWAPEGADKRIRLYLQYTWPSLQNLMDKPLRDPPYFAGSSDNSRTVSVVTNATWSNWLVKTIDPVLWRAAKLSPSKPVPWEFVHHAIAATMLTHALAQGDFS